MPESLEFAFECSLTNGLHVRPASHLSEVANRFASACRLTNLRNGSGADLKSVLATVAADVRPGDRCSVSVVGADQTRAAAELRRFIDEDLTSCDGPAIERAPIGEPRAVPRVLRASGAGCHFAIAASKGVGEGKIVVLGGLPRSVEFDFGIAADADAEGERVRNAFGGLRLRIQQALDREGGATEGSILEAHRTILDDLELWSEIDRRIDSGYTAGRAVTEAGEYFAALLGKSESASIRERSYDVQELCAELLGEMYAAKVPVTPAELSERSIVVAETLAPQQLLALDRDHLQGIVLESSGVTSHAMILARSLGIPAVVGMTGARSLFPAGEHAVVDGTRGLVMSPVTQQVRRFYDQEERANRRREGDLTGAASARAVTVDGTTIGVGVNILHPDELAPAFRNGADGIGLLRTEILFAGRQTPPSEDEQFAAYSRAVREAAGKVVILRTLDAGGDKPLGYLGLEAGKNEAGKNPFLGLRGIRVYPGHRSLILTQLRAMLRASASGALWMMAPMVSSVEEARWFRELVHCAKQDLRERSLPFDDSVRVGAMIEVPSAAFLLPHLARELDFFSLGTNDLSQYFFAADREDSRLAGIASVRGPAFLALLKQIADELKARGKWVGICGEMAGDPRNLALLVGLGLDEISVPVREVAAFKKRIADLSAAGSRALLDRATGCATAQEVELLLDQAGLSGTAKALLNPALMELRSESRTKEEAIGEVVNALYAAGYTDDRQALEEAIWARESLYPTGVGHAFAIPHCKSSAVLADAIAVLKLREAAPWGSLDQNPVRVVILFAARESAEQSFHMKVFSQLARKLMDENFRDLLLAAESPDELAPQVARELAELSK